MIQSLHISGFKAAKDVQLDDLGKINLFIGPNGQGKTTLLQAIFVFCIDCEAGKLLSLAPTELGEQSPEAVHRALLWLFTGRSKKPIDHHSDLDQSFKVSGTADGDRRFVRVNSVNLTPGLQKEIPGEFDLPSHGIQDSQQKMRLVRDSAKFVLELATEHEKSKSHGFLYVSYEHGVFGEIKTPPTRVLLPATITRRQSSPAPDLAKMLDEARVAGNLDQVERLLRTIEPELNHLVIGVAPNGSPVVRVDHRSFGQCPINALGDGLSAATRFCLLACSGTRTHLMDDEFDAPLHVSTVRELAKFAKEIADGGIQLFLTTHREDTLSAFIDLMQDGWTGLRVFQTRMENGEIKVQSFAGEQLLSLTRDLALDIRVPS